MVRGVWVAPDQIAHGAGLGNVSESIDGCDVVEEGSGGRESAVETEDAVVEKSGERDMGEDFHDAGPD